MKRIAIIISALFLAGCATTSSTGVTKTGITSAQVLAILNQAGNFIEQVNTGALAAAPTVEAILAMFHNQGDANLLANGAQTDATVNQALKTLLSNVQTAVAANPTGVTQQAAVSAAVAPPVTAALVAPIVSTPNNP